MIRKLLLRVLFLLLPIFKIRPEKFNFKIAFFAILLTSSFNGIYAQCNTASTGTVNSNTNKMCVGTTQSFSSNGWGGGTWSSSNPSVLEHIGNSDFRAIAPGTANVIYSITQSGCSEVKSSSKTINVYNALGSIGDISGNSPQCAGFTNQVYSIPAVTNASNYVWTVPSGWSITSGQGTTTINVTVGSSSQPGHISVYATNDCATSETKSLYSNVTPVLTGTATTNNNGDRQCGYAMLQWSQVTDATGYYLDIATDSGFTNYVPGFNNYNVGYNNGSSPVHNMPGGTLYFRVRAYNSCTTTAYSNTTSFTTLSPAGGSVSGAQTVCSGNTPTTNLTLTGNTGTIVKWEKSIDAAFTSPIEISNTSATLTGASIGALTTSTYFRAVSQSSYCYSNSTAVLITVAGAGTVSSAQTICTGTSPADLTLQNYTGSVTRWEKSSTSNFSSSVTNINVTSATLQGSTIGTLSSNTYFRAVVNAGACGTYYSPGILITITPNNAATLSSATGTNAQTTCINTAITNITYNTTGATGASFTGLPTGVTGSWSSNRVTISGTPSVAGTFSYTVRLTGNCETTVSGSITVNSPATASVSIVTDTPSKFCYGSQVRFNATAVNGGTPTYQWYRGTAGTTLINNQNANTILISNLVDGEKIKAVMTSTSTCVTGSPATSNEITVSVYMTDRGRTNGGRYICQGTLSPELTVVNAENPNQGVEYTNSSRIIRWEYRTLDAPNTWIPIANTGGLTRYTPPVLSVTTDFRAVAQTRTPVECPIVEAAIETRIDVNTAVSITSQSTAGQTRCDNTAFNSISVTATGSPQYGKTVLTYQWYRNTTNSNTGGTSLVTANGAQTNTYTPQFGTQGVSYYYYCVVTGYCNSVTSAVSGAFINNSTPTAPTASVTTQPTCASPTGTITITTQTGVTYSINGTDYYNSNVFSSLAPGYYTISVRNSSGCTATRAGQLQVLAATAKTWTGSTSNNWNTDGNWSPSGIPTSSDCVVIPSGVTNNPVIKGTNENFYAYTLIVNDKASLTVQSTNTLNMTNGINVLSSATTSGVLEFIDSSSLLQSNTDPNINSGNILYNRTTLPIRQADYTYWSSPVKGETVGGVSPNTEDDKYYTFNSTSWVGIDRSTVMTAGKGYIIRGPEDYSNTERATYDATFKGVPNNGTITGETAETRKFYLVGNPYPSALDADTFILANTFLEGTLYFWTHNTPVVLGGYYRYSTDDYASYNLSGSVKTSIAAISGTKATGNNNSKPTGKIGAGQAFFAGTKGAGTFTFNNGMRVGGANNSQFFKPGSASKTTALEKNRVWLNMTNTEGAFKQLLVGYIEGATNGYDSGFDGVSFDGNKYLDFYSINSGTKYVIQGRSLPFDNADTVPLGYRTTIAGDFTIAIDETDGSMDTQAIYLEDKNNGTIHDLRASNYTFTTAIGTFADRFVLRYVDKTLGTGDFESTENGIVVSVKDKVIQVLSSKENLKEVTVYDITGKLLFNKTKVNATELQVTSLQSSNQVLLVKVTLENDYKTSKKIIFN